MIGDWQVRHRRLNARLTGCADWTEFTGKSSTRKILVGSAMSRTTSSTSLTETSGPRRSARLTFDHRNGRSGGLAVARLTAWACRSSGGFLARSGVSLPMTPWTAIRSQSVLPGTQIPAETRVGNKRTLAMAARRGRRTGPWNLRVCEAKPLAHEVNRAGIHRRSDPSCPAILLNSLAMSCEVVRQCTAEVP